MEEGKQKYKWCVIVPTYNNARTLTGVLNGVLSYTPNVLVINDGSTDSTTEILLHYSEIKVITHSTNQGKGIALKHGFRKALDMGFDYAITIDSDGQHFPDDIPVFLDRLKQSDGNLLLIGARNMQQAGVPKKSSFGNTFSNFWFKFETGIQLEDTQSGYRLYPLAKMPKRYYTPKFEFEIESIVRAAWSGVQVENVPVKVHYDLKDRVSHFRPFRDFTRISILNTVLVLIALLYIKPRDFFRNLKKKDFRKFIKDEILESTDSSSKKSFSMALGVFWGIVPLWGFQTFGVLSSAYILRLNKLIAFTFSNVSLPPFIPFIIYGSLKVGALFVKEPVSILATESLSMDFVKKHLLQYIIGSSILAILSAFIIGLLGYLVFNFLGKKQSSINA
jgi:glycosyltransferase involved in cell wall biosynthesis